MANKTAMDVLAGNYEHGDKMMSMAEEESMLPKIDMSIRVETGENGYVIKMCDYTEDAGAGNSGNVYSAKEKIVLAQSPGQAGLLIMRALGKNMKKGMSYA